MDLTIARGLDYYTGTVYETTMLDHPEIGSICSGGRYDNLAEYYTDKQLPGVGISIGLTRLFFVLEDQGYAEHGPAHRPGRRADPAHDRGPVRRHLPGHRPAGGGIRTQIHCEEKKFKQKISYADKLSIPYVIALERMRSAPAWWPARTWPPAADELSPPPPSTASKPAWRSGKRAPLSGSTRKTSRNQTFKIYS